MPGVRLSLGLEVLDDKTGTVKQFVERNDLRTMGGLETDDQIDAFFADL